MKRKNRFAKITYFLLSIVCFLGVFKSPLFAEEVSEKRVMISKSWEEVDAECIEVSSVTELAREVNEESRKEAKNISLYSTAKSGQKGDDYSGTCLVVSGDVDLEDIASGAEKILKGYGNVAVLFYGTKEAAREACDKMTEKGITAEINEKMESCGQAEVFSGVLKEETDIDSAGEKPKGEGAKVTVAVLDSGYDKASLGDSRIIGGVDLTGGNDWTDQNGHGTAMAAIILEHTNDAVKVMPVKVADEAGTTTVLHLYMGIRYAIEQKVDIINISMSAYKSMHSSILDEVVSEAAAKGIMVVVSGGNQGEDTKNYTPANLKDAVTVSAVNSDKTRADYSNYGEAVDYCAYGSLEVTVLLGNKVTASGTSVSAGIVSSLMAFVKSNQPGMSGEELLAVLDGLAEDLGEKGKDIYYGKGFLTFDSIVAKEEEGQAQEELPELLTCDWRSLSDEALNELILEAEDIYKKRFLDDMSKEERMGLLSRKNILYNHSHGAVIQDLSEDFSLVEEKRFQGTLYEYLYSDFFREFQVNGSVSKEQTGAGQTVHISADSKGGYYVNLTTSQNKSPARLYVWIDGYSTNPTSTYTLHAEGTDAGAFEFSDISVSCNSTGSIYNIMVGGIQVTKTAHTTLKDKYQTRYYVKGDPDYKEDESGDGGLGGFVKPGSDSCASEKQKISFDFSHNDGEHSSSNGDYALTYQLNYSGTYDTTPGDWGDWTILKDNTCTKDGKRVRSRKHTCNNCGKETKTESQEKTIPAHGHNFETGTWKYDTCPTSGIKKGQRYEQCTYKCKEEGWRRNYEYLNEIYYHAMKSDGTYPSKYTLHSSSYYPKGAAVPGYTYMDTDQKTDHRTTVLSGYKAPGYALQQYVDIPRKEYTVKYNGNGADSGTLQEQKVYFGQTFSILSNGFARKGYELLSFNTRADGKGESFSLGQKVTENLTTVDKSVVNLYAQWSSRTYKITLDGQGAKEQGTPAVYQKYSEWYSKSSEKEQPFSDNKIVIPEKTRKDESLLAGERKQKFLGYFTEKNGNGNSMIKEDGLLISNIAKAGDYRYFMKDSTVYAHWQDMYALQYSDNLTLEDKEVVGEEKNILPEVKWKERGKDITLVFEGAEIANENFKGIYRLMGWSLTPEIASEEELVLSPKKTSYTFTEDKDVTLYAQWDSSYRIAYMGNQQSFGRDYVDVAEKATETYRFSSNDKEEIQQSMNQNADYFEKYVEKGTRDVVTGNIRDAAGNSYTEILPYSFQGWSMYSDWRAQTENKKYFREDGEWKSKELILDAIERAAQEEGNGLTFGMPVGEFGTYNAGHVEDMENSPEDIEPKDFTVQGMPYINMFAIWDEFPQIQANDMYFSVSEAQSGMLTQDYLLGCAEAYDRELEGITDEKGTLSHGEDTLRDTLFCIPDYRDSDFIGAEGNMSMTITYYAKDAAGNVTTKMVNVHLVDTTAKAYNKGKVRFISDKYIDTLSENSIWRTEEYASILSEVLNNSKTGEEYTTPSAVEQFFGAKPVKKPGSGTWNKVMQIWEFTHEQVLEVQEFMENNGIQGSQKAFLDQFGSCRVQ